MEDISISEMEVISISEMEDGMVEENKFINDVLTVDELNKRQLGKIIIKYCGNEGCENTEQKADLRRLLQAAIDYIPMKTTVVWENAEFTIYDKEANSYRIRSGKGKNRFMVKYSYLTNQIIVQEVSKFGMCSII